MSYSIDKKIFLKYAQDIVDYITVSKNEKYEISNIEIGVVLMDYDDGLGYRLVCRAMVRNPTELAYDYVVDILGSPEDALTALLKQIKEEAELILGKNFKVKNNRLN